MELGKTKGLKPAISPAQAKALRTGANVVSSVVGPGKAKGLAIGLTKAARLAKEAKEVAEKAAGFSKPRVPMVTREVDYSPTPAKPVVAKPEEKVFRRGVEEPKEISNNNLAVEKAKAFGLGSVSPEQRAAIEAQMNRGLRPDMPPLRTNPLPPEAVSIRPPLAPGMRKWTPETKIVIQPMKPALPKPQVFDIKSSGTTKPLTQVQRERIAEEQAQRAAGIRPSEYEMTTKEKLDMLKQLRKEVKGD
jgi:hypothetical protein